MVLCDQRCGSKRFRECVRACRKSGSEFCEAILSKAEHKADVRATLLSYKAVMFNCARDDRVLKT
jgi:hypothetical protein